MYIPRATYRIQFTPEFGFSAAEGIIEYLAELGISDLYASPIFRARRGSQHGYDVVDPNAFNPQLGPPDDFDRLSAKVRRRGMGWLQDIVPNHMAFDSDNAMLMDILENGAASPFIGFFDIEWEYRDENIYGRLLTPLLGRFYAEALSLGEIRVEYDRRGLSVNYYDLRLPLRLESYVRVFEQNISALEERLGRNAPAFIRFLGDIEFLRALPRSEPRARATLAAHEKGMLWALYGENPVIREHIDQTIALINGIKGVPESFDALDRLLSDQLFRLAYWKVANEELNYRRFFTINELISVRVEKEEVYEHNHSLVSRLTAEGKITGLRIDHIDGLHDPTTYLRKLRSKNEDLYVVVEKILQRDEKLPAFWPVQGTTGYDFLNSVNGIFCRSDNEPAFNKVYGGFVEMDIDYPELIRQRKRLIIGNYMAGDIDNLARSLKAISGRDRQGSDITLYGLRRALVEIMSAFPVYRTYVSEGYFRERDESYIKAAIESARAANPALAHEYDFLEKFLLLERLAGMAEDDRRRSMHFIMSFQQYTGPLMAKGFEDTVLYIFNRLMSLNEVGGDPLIFGTTPEAFHDFNAARSVMHPHALNATSTHDTKRGEDVRARLNVLSELPGEWGVHLKLWRRLNRAKKKRARGRVIPDYNDEYMLYQALLGTYDRGADPGEYRERIRAYIIKAVREAKVHTAWIKPDEEYENGFASFAERIMRPREGHGPREDNLFLKDYLPFAERIAHYGAFNSLSQTIMKITSPGVPDFYQGSELWDLNLVDPDNRRPVDFDLRQKYLAEIRQKSDIPAFIKELLTTKQDGRIKMFLIWRALGFRRENEELFREGRYVPLAVTGGHAENVVAFAREREGKWAVTVAPRFPTGLVGIDQAPTGSEVWGDTSIVLPENLHTTKNVITGQEIDCGNRLPLGEALAHFPAALIA